MAMPVVFYRGAADGPRRHARSAMALAEGARGEAVRPDELFSLIAAGLTDP